jgi:DNA polymerase-3 subunit delta
MKINPKEANSFLQNPARSHLGILLYGPDDGLIRERAKQVITQVMGKDYDPMNLSELTEDRIKQDPAILQDELSALSLLGGGGKRVVYIRDASDKIASMLQEIYRPEFRPTAYLILASDDLGPSSALRKWSESETHIASIGCYHDEGKSLEQLIRAELEAAGIKSSQDVIAFLSEHCGNDRQITKQEIEKIKLFQGKETYLTLDHAAQLVGQNDFFTLDDLCMAVASGNVAEIESYLVRLLRENIQPVVIIRSVQRYFQRLETVRNKMAENASIDVAMGVLRPPVFFKFVPQFRQHVNRWNISYIQSALRDILQAERDLKTTGYPASLMLSHALITIATRPSQREKAA